MPKRGHNVSVYTSGKEDGCMQEKGPNFFSPAFLFHDICSLLSSQTPEDVSGVKVVGSVCTSEVHPRLNKSML